MASAQVVLQCFFPFAGTQLQAGCAHLDDEFMGTPFCSNVLFSSETIVRKEASDYSLASARAANCSVLVISGRNSCGRPFGSWRCQAAARSVFLPFKCKSAQLPHPRRKYYSREPGSESQSAA